MEFVGVIQSVKAQEETGSLPRWYRLNLGGAAPSPRVGHSCVWLPVADRDTRTDNAESYGKIVCVGGADPSGSHRDVHVLDLDGSLWKKARSDGFLARYEHSAFGYAQPAGSSKVVVFGGADENGNRNDVQEFTMADETWASNPLQSDASQAPTPRTHHTAAVINDNRLIVFGGGKCSSLPVQDTQVHLYNAVLRAWTQPKISGEPPKPRQGHLMMAIENKVYLHGGMSGTEFFDDLYELDLGAGRWTRIRPDSPSPRARAGHGGISAGTSLIIFGGLTAMGVANDLHSFHTETLKWTELRVQGDVPSPRLDFAIGKIPVDAGMRRNTVSETAARVDDYLMFLHGGMNVEGDVFNEAYVCHLKDGQDLDATDCSSHEQFSRY